MNICLIHLFFTKKYQKGYTKGKLLEKSCFFQNFDFFTKFQIFSFFYPFLEGGLKVPYPFSIPHKYHVKRSNRKKVMGNLNFSHKKRQILYIIVVGKVDCMICLYYSLEHVLKNGHFQFYPQKSIGSHLVYFLISY